MSRHFNTFLFALRSHFNSRLESASCYCQLMPGFPPASQGSVQLTSSNLSLHFGNNTGLCQPLPVSQSNSPTQQASQRSVFPEGCSERLRDVSHHLFCYSNLGVPLTNNPRPQGDTNLMGLPYLVNLEDWHQRCVEVIALRLFGVKDLNGVLPAF